MGSPTVEIVSDGNDLFVLVDGVKIAKREPPGTAKARTWVSLEPGWRVLDQGGALVVEHNGVRVHDGSQEAREARDRLYKGVDQAAGQVRAWACGAASRHRGVRRAGGLRHRASFHRGRERSGQRCARSPTEARGGVAGSQAAR